MLSCLSDDIVKSIIEQSIINKPREKELKDTKSWSANTLIKLFFKVKEVKKESMQLKNPKEFVEVLKKCDKLVFNQKDAKVKLEDSGYLTFIDMDKDTQQQIHAKTQ